METRHKLLSYCILLLLILLPYVGMFGLRIWYKHELDDIDNAAFIVISKEEMNLRLIDYKGREIEKYPIACGMNYGNKETAGDLKTPEGLFHITEIENASNWTHDFGDGKGEINGAYGPYFIRLEVPGHKGIGIHGTHKPESIGTRDTEGCIRLQNEDLTDLVERCHIGMAVFVTPSYLDVMKSGKMESLSLALMQHEQKLNDNKLQKTSLSKDRYSNNKTIKTDQIKLK